MFCKLFKNLKRTDDFELKSENEHGFDVCICRFNGFLI